MKGRAPFIQKVNNYISIARFHSLIHDYTQHRKHIQLLQSYSTHPTRSTPKEPTSFRSMYPCCCKSYSRKETAKATSQNNHYIIILQACACPNAGDILVQKTSDVNYQVIGSCESAYSKISTASNPQAEQGVSSLEGTHNQFCPPSEHWGEKLKWSAQIPQTLVAHHSSRQISWRPRRIQTHELKTESHRWKYTK